MLLRVSSEDPTLDLSIVMTGESGQEGHIPDEERLVRFAEAVIRRDAEAVLAAGADIRTHMGDEQLVDAAATVAHFNGITRVADGTGIQLDRYTGSHSVELRQDLGIDRFDTTA